MVQPTVKKRLWITLLNESYFENDNINKGDVIGYFIIKPDNIKKHNATKEKNSRQKTKYRNNYLPKEWSKRQKSYFEKKKKTSRRQTGGFLNRYNFAYVGTDVVNQARKVAPKFISQATAEINKIAQQRTDQIVRFGRA